MKEKGNSIQNLDGGVPDKLPVEASRMTTMIYPVCDTYFCGVGPMPGTSTERAAKRRVDPRQASGAELG